MYFVAVSTLLLSCFATAQAPAQPDSPPDEASAAMLLYPSESTSIGGPADGRLEGGVALPMVGPGFRFNTRRRLEARFGTVETVQALVRAAALVASKILGSELTINDLGFQQGGPISQHGSHQNGRDVDVLYYLMDPHGRSVPSVGAPLDPRGRGWDFHDLVDPKDDVPLRLDARRTWRFIQAVIEDPKAHLQRIFMAEHLRTLLLQQAQRSGARASTISIFADLTCQPRLPHDDHMHLRFFCSAEDIGHGCKDAVPVYPWQVQYLRQQGTRPVIARPEAPPKKAKTTSAAEARARAGNMHARVRAFLDRRETWLHPPRTGRPYCH